MPRLTELLTVLALTLGAQSMVHASNQPDPPQISKQPGDTCSWEDIGAKWNVPPALLYAIAVTESSLNPRAINRANRNGSEDVGLMQINSWWFPRLARIGITRDDLFDPCVSLDVAGYILHDNISRHGMTWKAVGEYNSPTLHYQKQYVRKVFANMPR